MKEDGFDDNKAYASEIVSILLQNSPESRKLFTEANGIDTLLLCLAVLLIIYLCNYVILMLSIYLFSYNYLFS